MLATGGVQAVYPVVEVEVLRFIGHESWKLLYISGTCYKLDRNPDRREYKRIEMMMTWTSQKIEMYKIQVSNIK